MTKPAIFTHCPQVCASFEPVGVSQPVLVTSIHVIGPDDEDVVEAVRRSRTAGGPVANSETLQGLKGEVATQSGSSRRQVWSVSLISSLHHTLSVA